MSGVSAGPFVPRSSATEPPAPSSLHSTKHAYSTGQACSTASDEATEDVCLVARHVPCFLEAAVSREIRLRFSNTYCSVGYT